jgi:hypothetical protein
MNNVIQRKITVTGSFAPLATNRLVGTFEISCPPTNIGNVLFLADDGSEVPWVPSEYHLFKRVDLASIRIKGLAGDIVTVVGGTW